MKATGVVRKVSSLGRFYLPKELRDIFDINIKDKLEIYVDNERIILMKYAPACVFCGDTDNVYIFKGKHICSGCISEAKIQSEV